MKNEIYDINKIYWFISKSDKDSEINTIAVPYLKNEYDEMQNLLNDSDPIQTTPDAIIRKLNAENNRNNFKFFGDMKSVLATLVHLNFVKALIPVDVQKKQNATTYDILRTKIVFEKSINKWEKSISQDRAL